MREGLSGQIGAPRELEKNLEDPSYFERAVDLSLPAVQKESPVKTTPAKEAEPRASTAPTEPATEVAAIKEPEIKARAQAMLGEVHYTPIKALNTFTQEWKVKARLTKKHALKSWKNAKTAGVLLNIELMDSLGTQITATFFNDLAKRWDAELQEGKVYTFANGSIKIANQKYTSIKNDYTIVFDRDSAIEEVPEDRSIQSQGFSFVTIEEINDFEQQRTVDVAGVITSVGTVSSFQPKSYDGNPRPAKDKRSLQLADETGLQIQVTLWGTHATRLPFQVGAVLAIKGARVSDYGGKSLNAGDEHS